MNVTPFAMPGAKPPQRPRPDPGAVDVDAPLEPGPTTPAPAAPAVQKTAAHAPLYGVQYVRREALRLAVDYYRDMEATDDEVLGVARRFADFIRFGTTTTEGS